MNYKKPGFWIVIFAVAVCVAAAVYFLANPARNGDSLKWPQALSAADSADGGDELVKDIAYHLELSALGREFQDMANDRKDMILREYGQLLEGYSLMCRESTDGAAMYIVGTFHGAQEDSPHGALQSMEVHEGNREYQMLYAQEDEEAVNEKLADSGVGYTIQDSRISIYAEDGVILIQPEHVKADMGSVLSRYLNLQQGRAYIRDAVSRGVSILVPDEPYLHVYLISEQFGEIVENIPLTDAEANAILDEERTELTDGLGFHATLHSNDSMELFSESMGVPQTALNLATERCGYQFAAPSSIKGSILEARLDCDWLEKPLYAGERDLERLREILVNAEFGYVGACGYGARLTIGLTGGEQLTMFKATDGCDTIVFGSYGGYFLGDKENTEFWEIFSLDAETKELLGNHSDQ